MDFLKRRVRQYQEKKLGEILSKIKFHVDMQERLERETAGMPDGERPHVLREIRYHEKNDPNLAKQRGKAQETDAVH